MVQANQKGYWPHVPTGLEGQDPIPTGLGSMPLNLTEDTSDWGWNFPPGEASSYGLPYVTPETYSDYFCFQSNRVVTPSPHQPVVALGNFEYTSELPWLNTLSSLEMVNTSPFQSSSLHSVPTISAQSYDLNSRADTNESFWPSRIQHSHLLKISDLYLRQIHPSIPFFKTADVLDGIKELRYRSDRNFGLMVLALCTSTLLQPQEPNLSLLSGDVLTASNFLEETLALRRCKDIDENPTLDSLLTDIYLFVCFDILGQKNAAWMKLQEAITASEVLELANSDVLYVSDPKEWEKRNRLYLCLVIAERSYVFGRWRRISVPAVPQRVLERFSRLSLRADFRNDLPESRNISVLYMMAETFGGLESDLLQCWNGNCKIQHNRRCDKISSQRILGLLRRVPGPGHKDWLHIARSQAEQSSEKQGQLGSSGHAFRNDQGDVLLTCLWIMSRLFRLALQHGHVSSGNTDWELQPSFPIIIARMCLDIIKSYTISGLELHGEGLAEKMFDVASEFIRTAYPEQGEGAVMLSNFARQIEPVELQDYYALFASNDDQSMNAAIGSTTCQNSFNATFTSEGTHLSNFDIANGFLGFFALFRNGQHEHLQSYIECYKRLACNRS
ncbi:hypothetical protein ACEPPN_000919 [Leptodophora sp. 'Broadleaf-Isolate-01']